MEGVPPVPCMKPGDGKGLRQEDATEEIHQVSNDRADGNEKTEDTPRSKRGTESIKTSHSGENINVTSAKGRRGHCRCYFKGKRLR